MADTYTKQAGNQILSVTLRDLGIDESTTYGGTMLKNYNKLFVQLTLFIPTNQSHLGIKFDDYTIDIGLSRNGSKLSPELIEGVGLTPDYYTSNNYESIEIVKHLTNDEDLCLPKPYMDKIIYCINNDIKKWQTWTFYEHLKAKFYYE